MMESTVEYLRTTRTSDRIMLGLAVIATILSILTYHVVMNESGMTGLNPHRVMGIILCDLIVLLTLCILVTRRFLRTWHSTRGASTRSSLQHRIILTFSLVAAIPTILISVFSTYFFSFGLQSWFDQKISKVLDQSIIVAHSYIAEHTLQLKETASLVASDLSNMYYDLIHDPVLFNKTLNAEAKVRSLSEAIVFQRGTHAILAQTALSFSLSFATIPLPLIERASKGEVVQVSSDPKKIRMLVKLKEYNDTYLLVGRLVDRKIIKHIDQTNGAAQQYNHLRNNISHMQIMFSLVFIFVALLLLLVAITWGSIFAGRIIRPIRKLVSATEKVQQGDLTVQVSEEGLSPDEIKVLTSAFNRMIKQIDRGQKDLLIAQRALAWSDVARRVAHEIKNPLTPIQLSAERLLKKFEQEVSDRESFKRYIETIIRHNNDIKTIVSEFVNFARLPAPTLAPCELVEVVTELVESRKSINDRINYSLISNEPVINFVFDATQLRQVMLNLIKNAEESLEEIEVNPTLTVHLEASVNQVVISVEDNGRGFNEELIHKATEAYVSSRAKGMGLGLAIVKKMVQDHFGTMKIENRIEGGAIVTLIFNTEDLRSKLNQG